MPRCPASSRGSRVASDPLRRVRTRGAGARGRGAHPPHTARAAGGGDGADPASAAGPARHVRASGSSDPSHAHPDRTAGSSDPLAARAAELHAKALAADAEAARYRAERDEIIDRLRRAEPERWSYTALARALGCSRELIAQIVRRRR